MNPLSSTAPSLAFFKIYQSERGGRDILIEKIQKKTRSKETVMLQISGVFDNRTPQEYPEGAKGCSPPHLSFDMP